MYYRSFARSWWQRIPKVGAIARSIASCISFATKVEQLRSWVVLARFNFVSEAKAGNGAVVVRSKQLLASLEQREARGMLAMVSTAVASLEEHSFNW